MNILWIQSGKIVEADQKSLRIYLTDLLRYLARTPDCINNDCSRHSPPWERYHITTRSIGAADALQVLLICFAAFENHFCGHEQECAGVYRGTFSADNPLKFSKKVSFCGMHGKNRRAEGRSHQDNGRGLLSEWISLFTRMCTVGFFELLHRPCRTQSSGQ